MKMKLTDKAIEEIIENGMGFEHPSKWEFQPSDFEGMVCLTVEEARKFLKQIDQSIDPTDKHHSYSKVLLSTVRLSIIHQLEQAESVK